MNSPREIIEAQGGSLSQSPHIVRTEYDHDCIRCKPDPHCLQNEGKMKNQPSFEKNNLTKFSEKTLEVCMSLLSTLLFIFNPFSEERAGQTRTHHVYINDILAISGKVVRTEYCSRVLLGSCSW